MKETVDKCLAFCQALAKDNRKFSITLTIGKDSFHFSTSDQRRKVPARQDVDLKKGASSRQRRREERATDPAVRQKAATHAAKTAEETAAADQNKVAKATANVDDKASFNCDQCEYSNASEKGLKQHMRMKHKPEVKTPEKERNASLNTSLNTSPVKVDGREEVCPCCGDAFTSDHQCGAASLEPQGAETAAHQLESPALPSELQGRLASSKERCVCCGAEFASFEHRKACPREEKCVCCGADFASWDHNSAYHPTMGRLWNCPRLYKAIRDKSIML